MSYTNKTSEFVDTMIRAGIDSALKNAYDCAIKKAKDEMEKELSASLANIAIAVQRQFLVYEDEHRIVIEIRGKL